MKKSILFVFMTLQLVFLLKAETVSSIIEKNNFYINCYEKINEDEYFWGTIIVKNGVVECLYPLSNEDVSIENEQLVIYAEKHIFSRKYETDDIVYRDFYFPKRYKVCITNEQFCSAALRDDKTIKLYINTDIEYSTTCQAIVTENLNVRDSPKFDGKIIGRIEKKTEITLYGKNKNINSIDDIEALWYKVKLPYGKEGWIFGAYAKIFFENEYMGKIDKAGILKSIK